MHHRHLTHPDNDTGEYLRKFSQKFETAPTEYLAARGTLILQKNRIRKSRVRLPLKGVFRVTVLAEHLGMYLTLLGEIKNKASPKE